ncbi:MAG: serine protein kinase RIO [Thermoplasmata archaeon]
MPLVDEKRIQRMEFEIAKLNLRDKTSDWRKIENEVFTRDLMLTLYKLMNDGYFETLDYPISTGKEGNVFKASGKKYGNVAVKIYRVGNANFNRIGEYIKGDRRFKFVGKDRKKIIFTWAQKEFRNLKIMFDAGVRVPEPLEFLDNVVVMKYIGTNRAPAPMIKDVEVEEPEKIYKDLVRMYKLILKSGLVHGDLSEFNLMYFRKKVYIIDVGQAVTKEHPRFFELLRRDVLNIARYFGKLGVEVDGTELLQEMMEVIKE